MFLLFSARKLHFLCNILSINILHPLLGLSPPQKNVPSKAVSAYTWATSMTDLGNLPDTQVQQHSCSSAFDEYMRKNRLTDRKKSLVYIEEIINTT